MKRRVICLTLVGAAVTGCSGQAPVDAGVPSGGAAGGSAPQHASAVEPAQPLLPTPRGGTSPPSKTRSGAPTENETPTSVPAATAPADAARDTATASTLPTGPPHGSLGAESVPIGGASQPRVEVIPAASACNHDLETVVGWISIPAGNIDCPIGWGDQRLLDQGAVTFIDHAAFHWDPNLPFATVLGGSGTTWIAAHRTSHGGPFRVVPDLPVGTLVTLTDPSGRQITYAIVGRLLVHGSRPDDVTSSVFRDDLGGAPGATGAWPARLVLQTSEGSDGRWMVYADSVAGG